MCSSMHRNQLNQDVNPGQGNIVPQISYESTCNDDVNLLNKATCACEEYKPSIVYTEMQRSNHAHRL